MGRLRRDEWCFVGWGAWFCWRWEGGMEHLMEFGAALKGSAVGMLRISLGVWLEPGSISLVAVVDLLPRLNESVDTDTDT